MTSTFPSVPKECMTSIITHNFNAGDLYKLCLPADPKQVEELKAKLYKTPNAILVPLQFYFAILSSFVSSPDVPLQLFWYLDHLQYLVNEYKWESVLAYHTLFFNERVWEMKYSNCYTSWGAPHYGLMSCLEPEDPLSLSKLIPTLQLECCRHMWQNDCGGQLPLPHYSNNMSRIFVEFDLNSLFFFQYCDTMNGRQSFGKGSQIPDTHHSRIWESFSMHRESFEHYGQLVVCLHSFLSHFPLLRCFRHFMTVKSLNHEIQISFYMWKISPKRSPMRVANTHSWLWQVNNDLSQLSF